MRKARERKVALGIPRVRAMILVLSFSMRGSGLESLRKL